MRLGETRHPERAEWGKPLEGVRILAIEQMQALPYATQLMANMGADVVKVEHPVHGESGRGSRPAVRDTDGRDVGATYLRNNLGKRSIGLDLKHPEGKAILERLVPHFDVVGENFKPGTLERLGLGYDRLSELHPGVILVSVSGFGNLGESPYRDWPAYAPIPEAMAGIYEMARTGEDPPRPLVAGALGDIGSALFAVIGTLAALHHRERTGLGQHVDVAMFDAMVAIADIVPFLWSIGSAPYTAGGSGLGIIEGYRAEDGWFVIEVIREHQFEALARLIGRPDWVSDPRFETRAGWDDHRDEIRAAIEEWAAGMTKLDACRALCAAGVAAGPSNTAADLATDEHVAAHGMLVEVQRPDGGDDLLVVGNPVKMSRVAEGPVSKWPCHGADTDDVLGGLLGIDDGELARLRSGGVIG